MAIIKILNCNEVQDAANLALSLGREANIKVTKLTKWVTKKLVVLFGGMLLCAFFFFFGLLFSKGE